MILLNKEERILSFIVSKKHGENGSAIECYDGDKSYYYNVEYINVFADKQYIKMKVFL
jgi:hypothetical protein